MREIKLTQGQVAIADDEDFERLNQFKWYALKRSKGTFYAARTTRDGGSQKTILMHRVVLDAPNGLEADHVDGDSLNNRKSNLRLATKQQNQFNQIRPRKDNKLGVKGVCWLKTRKKYQAAIQYNGKTIRLGRFESLVDADKAYRDAEVKYFGNFARQVAN